MNIKSFVAHVQAPSKKARVIAIIILSIIVALLVFQAGVTIGYKKASFSRQLGNNFYRAFDSQGPRMDRMDRALPGGFMFAESLPGGHGAVGKVASISLPTFVVAGPDNIEKIVLIGGKTDMRRFRDAATSSDLRVDDFVVVLGVPDGLGQIDARLIRILPPPPSEE